MLSVISTVKKLIEHSIKMSCKRQTEKNAGLKEVKDFMSNERAMIIYLIAGLI